MNTSRVALFLGVVMILAAFVACRADTNPPETTTESLADAGQSQVVVTRTMELVLPATTESEDDSG